MKHNKQIRLNLALGNAETAGEAQGLASEALEPQVPGPRILAATSRLRALGHPELASYVEEASAKVVLRGASTTLALAQTHNGLGAGFFDEAEDLKRGKDYHVAQDTTPVFDKLLRQYCKGLVVYARPGTPFFPPGAWVPAPYDPSEGPAVLRKGCTALRIGERRLVGGGWVWVRKRPEGGVASVRFPFHRAAIEVVKSVPGVVCCDREWQMEGDADASLLLFLLKDVFALQDEGNR